MTYREWYDTHADKHAVIVDKLLAKGYDREGIIDYFDFDNMAEAEPDFCPLYAEKKKCHETEKLNCYLCACPFFRFDDDGLKSRNTEHGTRNTTIYSECSIDAKEGKALCFGDAVHQDCSDCLLPHRRGFVEKHFDTDWRKIMRECFTP